MVELSENVNSILQDRAWIHIALLHRLESPGLQDGLEAYNRHTNEKLFNQEINQITKKTPP